MQNLEKVSREILEEALPSKSSEIVWTTVKNHSDAGEKYCV